MRASFHSRDKSTVSQRMSRPDYPRNQCWYHVRVAGLRHMCTAGRSTPSVPLAASISLPRRRHHWHRRHRECRRECRRQSWERKLRRGIADAHPSKSWLTPFDGGAGLVGVGIALIVQ